MKMVLIPVNNVGNYYIVLRINLTQGVVGLVLMMKYPGQLSESKKQTVVQKLFVPIVVRILGIYFWG